MGDLLVMAALAVAGFSALLVGLWFFATVALGWPPERCEGLQIMWWWGDVVPLVPDGARVLPVVPSVLTVGLRWV